MDIKTYTPRRPRVEIQAVQWDGSTPHAYEILAWVYREGGTGKLSNGYSVQGPDVIILTDSNVSKICVSGNWIVKNLDGIFDVMKTEDLEGAFEPTRPAPSVVRNFEVRVGNGMSLVGLHRTHVANAIVYSDRRIEIDLSATPEGKELYPFLIDTHTASNLEFNLVKRVFRGGTELC